MHLNHVSSDESSVVCVRFGGLSLNLLFKGPLEKPRCALSLFGSRKFRIHHDFAGSWWWWEEIWRIPLWPPSLLFEFSLTSSILFLCKYSSALCNVKDSLPCCAMAGRPRVVWARRWLLCTRLSWFFPLKWKSREHFPEIDQVFKVNYR